VIFYIGQKLHYKKILVRSSSVLPQLNAGRKRSRVKGMRESLALTEMSYMMGVKDLSKISNSSL
jgi:hypothetical protein